MIVFDRYLFKMRPCCSHETTGTAGKHRSKEVAQIGHETDDEQNKQHQGVNFPSVAAAARWQLSWHDEWRRRLRLRRRRSGRGRWRRHIVIHIEGQSSPGMRKPQ